VFTSDYKDFQVVGIAPPPDPPLNITRNAGRARINGIDLQLAWRPVSDWMFSFNGEYLDAKFTSVNAINPAYAVGDPVPLVPKYQFTTSIQRDFHLGDRWGYARLDYGLRGHETVRNRSIGTLFQGQSDVTHVLNFNTGVQWNSQVTFSVFGQNILNDRGYTDPYVFLNNASRVPPRTIGIQVSIASF
jgi:iron complex outermembrane receptor protein